MNGKSQVRGCSNITFIFHTNREAVSELEKTQANKNLEHEM